MKKAYSYSFLTLLMLLGPVYTAFTQAPEGFYYQAEARDNRGRLLTNTSLVVKTIIFLGEENIWEKDYDVTTNKYGLFSVIVGDVDGNPPESGNFTGIDWSNGIYFLNVQIQYSGKWIDTGKTQLISVPYALHAKTAVNATGTEAYVNDMLRTFRLKPNNYYADFYDIESNPYKTVKIGNQVWMAENLKSTLYCDGTPIPNVTVASEWGGLATPAYCWFNNNESYKDKQGALYNNAAVHTGKLCPYGWHVPIRAEYDILRSYLGGNTVAGGKAKSTGTLEEGGGLWTAPNVGATNESGLTMNPNAVRISDGSFLLVSDQSNIWTATRTGSGALANFISHDGTYMNTLNFPGKYGLPVRCLRDNNFIGTVEDNEYNVYRVVQIGSQVWMAENLRTTRDYEGHPIPVVTDKDSWYYTTLPACCWYENGEENKQVYGALYNAHAVAAGKLCPRGWHVPTQAEWNVLQEFLGGGDIAGGKAKSLGTIGGMDGLWQAPNTGATNESGFNAHPAGMRDFAGTFAAKGSDALFWSATPSEAGLVYTSLNNYEAKMYTTSSVQNTFGFSVRCLKD